MEENFRNYGDGAKNVRLSNSNIDSLAGLGKVLTNLQKHKIIISMSSLTWLDLSFNNITELGTDGGVDGAPRDAGDVDGELAARRRR